MDGIMIYASAFDICSQYDPDTQCRLVGYMARYALTGEEPDFSPDDAARYIWPAIKEKADRTMEAYEKKASAGRIGGTASAQNKQSASKAEAEPKQTASTGEAQPKQSASKAQAETKPEYEYDTEYDTDTDKKEKQERERAAEARFARFWEAYPRKTAKLNAKKAFMKLDPDDRLMDAMMAALDRWKRSDQWTRDPTYIPHPATWLNGERWNDQIPDPPKPKERTVAAQQYEQRDYSQEAQDDPPEWMLRRWEEMQREGTA